MPDDISTLAGTVFGTITIDVDTIRPSERTEVCVDGTARSLSYDERRRRLLRQVVEMELDDLRTHLLCEAEALMSSHAR